MSHVIATNSGSEAEIRHLTNTLVVQPTDALLPSDAVITTREATWGTIRAATDDVTEYATDSATEYALEA